MSAAGDTVVRGAYGTLTIHANGKYSYAADADIVDTLSPGAVSPREIFTYIVSDGNGGTDTATLTIRAPRAARQSGGLLMAIAGLFAFGILVLIASLIVSALF